MKTTLTIEQSAELIKRGVSEEKASEYKLNPAFDGLALEWKKPSPVFTLADLLSLLPKKITLEPGMNACLNIFMADDDYCVTSYTLSNNASIVAIGPCEPIDSFYRTLLWAIDHNHVKHD